MSTPRHILSTSFCDQTLLANIGSIAAESAYLEQFVETMLYRLTKLTREMGYPIIETPMLGGKLDLLSQIVKVKLKRRKKRLAQFAKIVSDIKNSNSERITAIHGLWLPANPIPAVGIINRVRERRNAVAVKRGRLDKPDTKLTAERAAKVAVAIYESHVELRDFALETWPKIFPPMPGRALPPYDQVFPDTQKDATTTDSPQ